ncbi:FtsX-like permease family protein [Jiangella alba]|uniref:Putative ABC transport system permease protein n=1 Tax=Jiangella alba TaxID=561176 RepID=A0A1H5PM49_9ACTN|nr:FtsX-like permease family protein [Jiangella alba]SEF14201.1 putative ABC transport system permease protein [Jiangella alba]
MRRPGRGWRPALRIARRQVRRNLGRSLLIAVLVGLPVAGATIADVLYRSADSPERTAYSRMGDADAIIEVTPWAELALPANGLLPMVDMWFNAIPDNQPDRDAAGVDLPALLPAGTVLEPERRIQSIRPRDGDTVLRGVMLDIGTQGGPLTDHAFRLDGGRWPEARDEVVVTSQLAERLDLLDDGELRPDATVTFDDGPQVRVTGLVVDPFYLDDQVVSAAPGSVAAEYAATLETGWGELSFTGGEAYLADLPAGTDVDELGRLLAADGVGLMPRDAVADPDQFYETGGGPTAYQLQQAALVALVVGLGLLEVVLLAGAAFAVGARRQVREIGLLVSGGASAAQVRRTVLAQGLVLGVIGAVLGVVAGALLVPAVAPLWEWYLGELIDDWTFGWVELVVAAAVGVLSGVAAAVVPAIGAARMKPVDALAARFRTTRVAARLPLVGLVLFVVGAGGALIASRIMSGNLADYGRQLEQLSGTGAYVNQPSTAPYIAIQLAGALVATAGLVVLLPGLISALARGAHRLGLSARLAVRDAARHRHRTAPAVAAIAIVVAGSTAVAFGAGGSAKADELRYTPMLPDNVIRIDVDWYELPADEAVAQLGAAEEAAARTLPGAAVHRLTEATLQFAADESYNVAWLHGSPECDGCAGWSGSVSAAVADPAVMAAAGGGPPDQAVLDAVAGGAMVVYDHAFLVAGDDVVVDTYPADGELVPVRFPGHVAERELAYSGLPGAFASAETLTAKGFELRTTGSIVTFDEATPEQLDAALQAIESAGAWASVETPFESERDPAVLALTAGAAFVTLVGVAIAVSLAAAEGRADLATLAAVGAPPRRRRGLAGAQALVVGGIGVLIGSGLGIYFAYLVWPALGAPDFIWAWDSLVLTGVAVPVLAVLVAVVFTPSRLPMIRRVE